MLICSWDDPPWLPVTAWDIPSCNCTPLSSSFTAAQLAVKSRALSPLPPTGYCWPISLVFPAVGKKYFWDKQPIEMSPASMESKRALVLSRTMWHVDIRRRQHFISCCGVITTLYNRSSLKCHSQIAGYEAHHVDAINSTSQPDAISTFMELWKWFYFVKKCTSLNVFWGIFKWSTDKCVPQF